MTFPIEFRWREDPPDTFGIPYLPNVREDGENFGYFDLKREPHRIDEVLELANWPVLKRILKTLNSRASFFRTVACDRGILDESGSPPTKRVGCYFRIAFEVLEWNLVKDNFPHLFDAIYQDCKSKQFESRVVVAAGIKSTRFNHHGVFGWTLMIDVSGHAPTEQEARHAWEQAMSLVEDVFKNISASKADELKMGKTTIS